MLALSIRQPYAEEILRGIKTVEYRGRKTGIVGQRFYIYAAKAEKVTHIVHSSDRARRVGRGQVCFLCVRHAYMNVRQAFM